jgi:hypothetical protein
VSGSVGSFAATVWAWCKRVGWHWLEVAAVAVALAAAFFTSQQARSASTSLRDAEAAAEAETASQVLLTGGAAPIGSLEPSGGGRATVVRGTTLRAEPHLVQNYGRLPIADLTVIVRLTTGDGDVRNYDVPVGSLLPCQQVRILDDERNNTRNVVRNAKSLSTSIQFTDPAGVSWSRRGTGPPMKISEAGTVDPTASLSDLFIRSRFTLIDSCAVR